MTMTHEGKNIKLQLNHNISLTLIVYWVLLKNHSTLSLM